MEDPIDRPAINALGRRLARAEAVDPDDLRLLTEFQERHQPASQTVGEALGLIVANWPSEVERAAFAINSRTKTSSTIVEKVRRGTRLSTMQDIVGYRVSTTDVAWTHLDQDRFAARLTDRFPTARLIDRRVQPMHGYRALHLVVQHDGFPVEVQLRTFLQDVWANQTEALGDAWGRGIRYGLPPDGDSREHIERRLKVITANTLVAERIYEYEVALTEVIHRRVAEELLRLELTSAGDPRATDAIERLTTAIMRPHIDRLTTSRTEFLILRAQVP